MTADELNLDPYMCAMNGGEDYELLFTVAQKDYEKIKNHPSFTVIGFITDKSQDSLLIDKNNSACLLYTSPSPRDRTRSRMPSSA